MSCSHDVDYSTYFNVLPYISMMNFRQNVSCLQPFDLPSSNGMIKEHVKPVVSSSS